MELKTIRDEGDIPFGPISNGYKTSIVIDNQKWTSVIDYISTVHGKRYCVDKPYYKTVPAIWDSLEKENINKAIQIGIDVRSKIDPEFEGSLLSSGTKPILYKSSNAYLGSGSDGREGENVYGKWLTSYRNVIIQNNPGTYYEAYILNRFLNIAIEYEPLHQYLDMARSGAGLRYLNSTLYGKYSKLVDIPQKSVIENIRAMSKQEFNYNPEEIILNVMKKRTRSIQTNNLRTYKYKVFVNFVQHVIRKYGIDYYAPKFAKELDAYERDVMIENVYDFWISDHRGVPDLYIPSDEDVRFAESETMRGIINPLPESERYSIVDEDASRLSIKSDKVPLDIEGLVFPSIYHYMIFSVAKLIEGVDPYSFVRNSRNNLFFSPNDSKRILDEQIANYKDFLFGKPRLEVAINAKFLQHDYMKELLKMCGGVRVMDYMQTESSRIINTIYGNIEWEPLFFKRGNVLDHLDTDDFMVFLQADMVESFLNILNTVSPNDTSDEKVVCVYNEFFDNIPGVYRNINREYNAAVADNGAFETMCRNIDANLSSKSCAFLKSRFVSRINAAQSMVQKVFKLNKTPIEEVPLFLTKFLIIEMRAKIADGVFINPAIRYSRAHSKEELAMANVIQKICTCNNNKVLSYENVERAYHLLTDMSTSRIIIAPKDTVEVDGGDDDNNRTAIVVGDNDYVPTGENAIIDEVYDEADDDPEGREVGYGDDEGNEDEDDDDNYDYLNDQMYAGGFRNNRVDATTLANKILFKLIPKEPKGVLRRHLKRRVIDLSKSKSRNAFRVNLWQ
jgi:hypothetical protein